MQASQPPSREAWHFRATSFREYPLKAKKRGRSKQESFVSEFVSKQPGLAVVVDGAIRTIYGASGV